MRQDWIHWGPRDVTLDNVDGCDFDGPGLTL